MLRITTEENGRLTRFRLEGRSSLLNSELQPCGFGHRLAVTQAGVGACRNEDFMLNHSIVLPVGVMLALVRSLRDSDLLCPLFVWSA
jgi:hypothetical protein